MSIHTVEANQVAPQPWRNGGGQTRELLAWPAGSAWQIRVSRADIAADGPFSEFAGVQRWFAVLKGSGVRLQFEHGTTELHAGDAPFQFDGTDAPHCTLVQGPTQDLNLMVRGGRGTLQAARNGMPWAAPFAVRGLYTTCAGVWSDGAHRVTLPAHTLLWSDRPSNAAWTFIQGPTTVNTEQEHNTEGEAVASASTGRAAPVSAWWLGFTPESTS